MASDTQPDYSVHPDPYVRFPAILRKLDAELDEMNKLADDLKRVRSYSATSAMETACKLADSSLMWLQKTRAAMSKQARK